MRWETHLQLIIDILVTNGNLLSISQSPCKKRIPVIAANTDLIYMSEVPLPRYDDAPPPLQIKDGETACFDLLILRERGICSSILFCPKMYCQYFP